MNHCRVGEQIAELAAEPECKECEECASSMTEEGNAGVTWYRCDKCSHVVFKDDEDEQ